MAAMMTVENSQLLDVIHARNSIQAAKIHNQKCRTIYELSKKCKTSYLFESDKKSMHHLYRYVKYLTKIIPHFKLRFQEVYQTNIKMKPLI